VRDQLRPRVIYPKLDEPHVVSTRLGGGPATYHSPPPFTGTWPARNFDVVPYRQVIGDVDHHAAGSVRAEGIGTERGGEISDEFEFSAVKELCDDDPRELAQVIFIPEEGS
jgi:hypothetical protein